MSLPLTCTVILLACINLVIDRQDPSQKSKIYYLPKVKCVQNWKTPFFLIYIFHLIRFETTTSMKWSHRFLTLGFDLTNAASITARLVRFPHKISKWHFKVESATCDCERWFPRIYLHPRLNRLGGGLSLASLQPRHIVWVGFGNPEVLCSTPYFPLHPPGHLIRMCFCVRETPTLVYSRDSTEDRRPAACVNRGPTAAFHPLDTHATAAFPLWF